VEFCFTLFDRDGNGTISKSEFFKVITNRIPMPEERMEEIFEAMAGGNQKEVNYQQFADFAKKNPVYLSLAKSIVKKTRPDEYIQLGLETPRGN